MKKNTLNKFLLYAVAAVGIVLFVYGVWGSDKVMVEKKDCPDVADAFAAGNYYFNLAEHPEGPYDVRCAEKYYKQAAEEKEGVEENVWYRLGRTQFIQSKFADAIISFESQIEARGDTLPAVYYMLGLAYAYKARETESSADWIAAEEAFVTYITHAPTESPPRIDLAWIYFMQGKYDAMRPIIQPAVENDPTNPWVLNIYGLYLLNGAKNTTAAHEVFMKAYALAENLTVEDWGRYYPGNNPDHWDEGLEEFRAAIAHNVRISEL